MLIRVKKEWFYCIGIIIVFIIFIIGMQLYRTLAWGNIILAFTAMVIIWYTSETRKLAKLTAKQIKIEIEPIIVIEDVDNAVKIKNVGKSPALNIDILKIGNRKSKDSKDGYDIIFANLPVLQSYCGDTVIAKFEPCGSCGHWNPNPSPFLDYRNPNFIDNYEIIVQYYDIEMGKWETKTVVDKNGIHFQGIHEIKS